MMTMSEDQVERKLVEDVERIGFSVIQVFDPEGDAPDFAYTLGLTTSFDHTELVIAGLSQESLLDVINDVAGIVASGRRVQSGDRVSGVIEGFDLLMTPVASEFVQAQLGYAIWLSGNPDLCALQILWSDWDGLFPGEDGFDIRLRGEQDLR